MPAVEIRAVKVKPSAAPELLCHPVPCWIPSPGREAARTAAVPVTLLRRSRSRNPRHHRTGAEEVKGTDQRLK